MYTWGLEYAGGVGIPVCLGAVFLLWAWFPFLKLIQKLSLSLLCLSKEVSLFSLLLKPLLFVFPDSPREIAVEFWLVLVNFDKDFSKSSFFGVPLTAVVASQFLSELLAALDAIPFSLSTTFAEVGKDWLGIKGERNKFVGSAETWGVQGVANKACLFVATISSEVRAEGRGREFTMVFEEREVCMQSLSELEREVKASVRGVA